MDHSHPLALQKFSHVTTQWLNSKCAWNHVSGPGLEVKFENIGGPPYGMGKPELALRVSRGAENIDTIHVPALIEQIASEEIALAGRSIADAARRVLVLEKKPYLAFRYCLENGRIHRIQMNFENGADFDRALQLLHSAGVHTRHKETNTKLINAPKNGKHMASSASAHIGAYPAHQWHVGAAPVQQSNQSHHFAFDAESHAASASSQPSRWPVREYQHPSQALIGPSLVESISAQQFQLPPLPQHPSHTAPDLRLIPHAPSALGSLDEYRYHPHEGRALHTANSAESAPAVRRSLFNSSCGTDDNFGRPGTAPARPDALGKFVPPPRDLPFSKPMPISMPESAWAKSIEPGVTHRKSDSGMFQGVTTKPVLHNTRFSSESQDIAQQSMKHVAPKRKGEAIATSAGRGALVWTLPDALDMLPSPLQTTSSVSQHNSTEFPTGEQLKTLTPSRILQSATARPSTPGSQDLLSAVPSTQLPLPLSFAKSDNNPKKVATRSRITTPGEPPNKRPKIAPPLTRPQTRSQRNTPSQEQYDASQTGKAVEIKKSNVLSLLVAAETQKLPHEATCNSPTLLAGQIAEAEVTTESARSSLEPRKSARLNAGKVTKATKAKKAVPKKKTSKKTKATTSQKPQTEPERMEVASADTVEAQCTSEKSRVTSEDARPDNAIAIGKQAPGSSEPTAVRMEEVIVPPLPEIAAVTRSTGAAPASTHIDPIQPFVSASVSTDAKELTVKSSRPVLSDMRQSNTAGAKSKRTPAPKKRRSYVSTGVQTTPQPSLTPESMANPSAQLPNGLPAPPPASSTISASVDLDVPCDWQFIVEAFVLRHRDRLVRAPASACEDLGQSVGHSSASMAPEASKSATKPVATPETEVAEGTIEPDVRATAAVSAIVKEPRTSVALEQLVIACIRDPGFERLCEEVSRVWGHLCVDGGLEMDI